MPSTSVKAGGFVSLVILLVAIVYRRQSAQNELDEKLREILDGLLRAEKKVGAPTAKIALGFGGCKDVSVEAIDLFNKLSYRPLSHPEHFDSVKSHEELQKLFLYFFPHGAAAERYVSNKTLFKELVDTALSLPDVETFMGGNAPVMAKRMALEGADVLLATRMSEKTMKGLSEKIKLVGSASQKDDIHLLMEYKTGAQWGAFTSPRANRLIVHSDDSNPFIETLEDFGREFMEFHPSLLVVGGLQMMDNFPFAEGVRESRLTKLQHLLSETPRKTQIHFELASFTDKSLLNDIIQRVIHYSDSLGMNEQELPNLLSLMTHGNISLVSSQDVRVATALDDMRKIYGILSKTNEVEGRRKLTRIHVHTLAYQAILTKKGAWKNTMSATAKASLTAHRHVCATKSVDLNKTNLLMDESFSKSLKEDADRIPFIDNRPVSCWDEDDYEICVAPVLVCTNIIQTAGGGDNISAAGLVLQV